MRLLHNRFGETPEAEIPEGTGRPEHLMVDGYFGNKGKLQDPLGNLAIMQRVMREVGAEENEMPYVIPYFPPYAQPTVPSDSGTSVIAGFKNGGHSTIHTFDKKRAAFFDIAGRNLEINSRAKEVVDSLEDAYGLQQGESYSRDANHQDPLPKSFGPHLMATVRTPQGHSIDNLFKLLDELPRAIGMTPISIPKIWRTRDGNGLSGMQVIAESHISAHTDPDGTTDLDIFSCKEFDIEAAKQYFARYGFNIDNPRVIARGLQFPKE